MAAVSNTKQKYADVKAELAERGALIATKRLRKIALEKQISQLVAEQELDNIDHSKRLPKLRAELDEISQSLTTWPDVEAELLRRLDTAQDDLRQLEYQDMLDSLEAMRADEVGQRKLFATQAMQFLGTAAALVDLLQSKATLRRQLLESGRGGIDAGDMDTPIFHAAWARIGAKGLAEAQQTYAGLLK